MALGDGIFMTPGREEEWTLTVAHDDGAVDRYAEVLRSAGELAP
jgi:glutamate-1-semialdehyde 2,1-aminomutase